jgi:hypothetical protein
MRGQQLIPAHVRPLSTMEGGDQEKLMTLCPCDVK